MAAISYTTLDIPCICLAPLSTGFNWLLCDTIMLWLPFSWYLGYYSAFHRLAIQWKTFVYYYNKFRCSPDYHLIAAVYFWKKK